MAISTNVPSDQFEDLQRDVQDATRYSNSTEEFQNRVGRTIRPIPLQEQDAQAAILSLGWNPKGTFAAGGTVEQANEVFSDGSDYWRYDGALPFTVTAGSSPTPTGVGAWLNVTDNTLRSELAAAGSEVLIAGIPAKDLGTGGGSSALFSNVKDFGAVGDGVADDTAAIQLAVDTDTTGTIFFPQGTYIISGSGIQLADRKNYIGVGKNSTILRKKDNTGATDQLDPIFREVVNSSVFESLDDVLIEGISFIGNGSTGIQTNKGAGLIRFYEGRRNIIRNCTFAESRGYGIGLQGARSAPNETKRGPLVDILIEGCDFTSNGLASYLLGSDTDDGLDVKSCVRLTVRKCKFIGNGDKGIDVRGRDVLIEDCHSADNASAGYAVGVEDVSALDPLPSSILDSSITVRSCRAQNNTVNGFVVVPQTTPTVEAILFVDFENCSADGNDTNFAVSSQGSNDLAKTFVNLVNCRSKDPIAGSRHFLASAPLRLLSINGGVFFGGSGAFSYITPNVNQVSPVKIEGAHFENMSGSVISISSPNCEATITGNVFKNVTQSAILIDSNSIVSANIYQDVSGSNVIASGSNNKVLDKSGVARDITRNGSTLEITDDTDVFQVTTTSGSINTIPNSYDGRVINLRFSGSGAVVNDQADNIFLSSQFVPNSNDTLTLVHIGLNWFEISRSVN